MIYLIKDVEKVKNNCLDFYLEANKRKTAKFTKPLNKSDFER